MTVAMKTAASIPQPQVRHLLDTKGSGAVTIAPDATVLEALALMARVDIGALVVVDDNAVCGVISERDYARKVIIMGKRSFDTPVREVMSSTVFCVTPDAGIDTCMALMTTHRVRHLPVLEAERLVGIISIGDVVKAIIDVQQQAIEQLENYITGRA